MECFFRKLFIVLMVLECTNIKTMMISDDDLNNETHDMFKKACHDYHISPDKISFELNLEDGQQILGAAQPTQNKLFFTRGRSTKSTDIEFYMYHELAHMTDKKLYHYKKQVKPLVYVSGFILGAGLCAGGLLILDRFMKENLVSSIQKNILATVSVIMTIWGLGLTIGFNLNRYLEYKFEHRADRKACKKLLQKKSYETISRYYASLAILKLKGLSRTHPAHPSLSSEIDNLETCLLKEGFEITGSQINQSYVASIYKTDELLYHGEFKL